ncbi:MAG: protein phosphatase 2C domain-containing protein [Clostridiales bacterium]|nr:protein phosphatase 2C domain-containing protein [Clostridiales bacterium]
MNDFEDGNKTDDTAEITLELPNDEQYRLMQGACEAPVDEYILAGQVSTVIGTRESQQDSCYVSVNGNSAIGIVCDGMGGLNGGEIASQNATLMFVQDFEQVRYYTNNYYNFFCNEMVDIDTMVAELTDSNGDLLAAGTTLVAVAVIDGHMQFISVGDSKIYMIRGDKMACLNREHNYFLILNEQLVRGDITPEDYAREQSRGAALISYLGMGNVNLMDANPQPMELVDGDIIILCSDGLYKALSEEQIFAIIKKNPINLEQMLAELQEEASRASTYSQDNTSIVLLTYRKKFRVQ